MKLKTKISQLKKDDAVFLKDDNAEHAGKCIHCIELLDGRLCIKPGWHCYYLDEYNENMTHKRDSRMDILCGWEGYAYSDLTRAKIWKGDKFHKDRERIRKYLQKYLTTKKYSFKAIINNKEYFPKGFYYQGKFIILVGCEITNNTIRRKERIEDVEIFVTEI